MANVIFYYNGVDTTIQCNENEKMGEVCQKFCTKISSERNNLFFLYSGNAGSQFNEELTFEQMANSFDKERKSMNILVQEINRNTFENNSFVKSKHIICPICFECIKMSIRNYKIFLYDCKNGHTINNILLNEFEDKQKLDYSKIVCDKCKEVNRRDSYNNEFNKCFTCKMNLCPRCKTIHDNSHNIENYEKIYYICQKDDESYTKYCFKCKINFCSLCENEHITHETITLGNLIPDKSKLEDNLKNLRKHIDDLNSDIEDTKRELFLKFEENVKKLKLELEENVRKLNKVKDNMEIYYKIMNDLFQNYNKKNRNFEILSNLNNFKNHEILNDIDKIIEEENTETKFNYLLDLYNWTNEKIPIDENNISENKENTTDEVTMIYKISNNDLTVKILGSYFVESIDSNKYLYKKPNCSLLYDGKKYELKEYLSLIDLGLNKNKGYLKIKLKGIYSSQIFNFRCMFLNCSSLLYISSDFNFLYSIGSISSMFEGCSSLIYLPEILNLHFCYFVNDMRLLFSGCSSLLKLPDLSNLNTSNITNMSSVFKGCSSLLTLPDISKWNTSNVNDMSNIFGECSSLLQLPDISNWNTSNIINISYMFYRCSSLLSLPDISKWNTSKVKNMSFLFSKCSLLSSLPNISNWNTSKVNDIQFIFYECKSLLSLPDISRWNTSKFEDMEKMFFKCSSLSTLPDLSKWKTTKVKSMSSMFSNCLSLTKLPDISKWSISNIKDISYIFSKCLSLSLYPDISKWKIGQNLSSNKNILYKNMFFECVNNIKEKIYDEPDYQNDNYDNYDNYYYLDDYILD